MANWIQYSCSMVSQRIQYSNVVNSSFVNDKNIHVHGSLWGTDLSHFFSKRKSFGIFQGFQPVFWPKHITLYRNPDNAPPLSYPWAPFLFLFLSHPPISMVWLVWTWIYNIYKRFEHIQKVWTQVLTTNELLT